MTGLKKKEKKKRGAVKLKDRGSGRPKKKMCVGLKVLHSTVHTVK